MLKQIHQMHDSFTRKIAGTFGLSQDLNHRHRYHLNPSPKHKIHSGKQPHQNLRAWHKEHNKRVTEFHKDHAAKVERGENGVGFLAKWERLVYNKGKALIKVGK